MATKENNGELDFSNTSNPTAKTLRRKARPHEASSRLLLALLAGFGAAFLLAILLLASRLDDPGGSDADAFLSEQVALGQASPALMMHDKKSRLLGGIERLKSGYRKRLEKFHKLSNRDGPLPLDEVVQEAADSLDAVADGLQKDQHGSATNLKRDFVDKLRATEHNKHESMEQRFAGHLVPRVPPLPPHLMAAQLFGSQIANETISGKPTIAGITAIMQGFLAAVHEMEVKHKSSTAHQVCF